MYSFPLEKEKEKEEVNNVSQVSEESSLIIKKVPFVIGIIIFLIAFLDMIILFAVPYHRIRSNKHKLPNATFKNPNIVVIVFHFILHAIVMIVGVFVILFGIRQCDKIDHKKVKLGLIIICIIAGIFWIITICSDFYLTTNINTKMTVDQLISIMSQNPPINFAFIYTEDELEDVICSPDCETVTVTCYSKSGVIIPMKTSLTSSVYNFTDTPEMFYFTIQQKLNMTIELNAYFNAIMNNINKCDRNMKKQTEYYPIIAGDYIVSKKKLPVYLNKGTRIASILFGVGVYYELNSKSVPYITYTQHSNADVVQGVDYNLIFTSDSCNNYGQCSQYNKKPKP